MVWEDGGYGLIDQHQDETDMTFSFNTPVWSNLAHAFGWVHAPVSGIEDLPDVLRAAHSAEGPSLITLKVDYTGENGMPRAATAAQ